MATPPADVGGLFSGGSITSNIGLIIFILVVFVVIAGCIIGFVVWNLKRKQWNKIIPLYKGMGTGEKPYLFATYKAKEIKIGKAGDKLWLVKGAGKYINVATESVSKNVFPHYEASDGEWHNFSFENFDKKFKEMGIKLIPQDMRVNRLGIESAIERELQKKKGLWDMIKDFIPTIIFYMVVIVCVVIVFFQFSKIVDHIGASAKMLAEATRQLMEYETRICVNNQSMQGLVPAFVGLMIPKFRRKKK